MIVLRKKTFTLPTFGIKNAINAAGFGAGGNMSTAGRIGQGFLAAGKLGATAVGVGSLYATHKYLKTVPKALTGRVGDKEEDLKDR